LFVVVVLVVVAVGAFIAFVVAAATAVVVIVITEVTIISGEGLWSDVTLVTMGNDGAVRFGKFPRKFLDSLDTCSLHRGY
jgi:hypothetical protein